MQCTRILVVEDEPSVRSLLKDVLADKGRRIVTVESGKEALRHVADQEFDLVLLDLKLKAIGGIEVLANLRERWPDTAVIVLTGHASLETAVEAVRKGAHDYLFKPCDADELRESVRKALGARQQEVRKREVLDKLRRDLSDNLEDLRVLGTELPSITGLGPGLADDGMGGGRFLEWGALVIDLIRHTVTLDGQTVDLSPTQFDILTYLVNEAPRVVSPQELVREVQDYEGEPGPEEARNIIRSHIYHIREGLEAVSGQRDFIRTVRGVGYAMNEDIV